MKKLAFFDFDGTLTRNDTFIGFAKFAVGGKILLAGLKSLPDMVKWKLGLKSNSEVKEALFRRLFKGMDYAVFKALGEKYATEIDRHLRSDIMRKMTEHLIAGHQVLIVSASIGDWIRPWAASKGIAGVIATEVKVDGNGRLTGNFSTPNCHGAEKVNRILSVYPDLEEYETWGYGDSKADEAMLSIMVHACAI